MLLISILNHTKMGHSLKLRIFKHNYILKDVFPKFENLKKTTKYNIHF